LANSDHQRAYLEFSEKQLAHNKGFGGHEKYFICKELERDLLYVASTTIAEVHGY
jgi:hypothetical protein